MRIVSKTRCGGDERTRRGRQTIALRRKETTSATSKGRPGRKKKKTPTTTTTRDGALRKSKHSRHPGTSCPVRTSFRPPPTCPSDDCGDRPPPPSSFRSPIGAARPWCGKCSLFVSKIYKYLASGFRRLRIGDWEKGYLGRNKPIIIYLST